MGSWDHPEKPFCEGYLYDHEYANSFTSLFIVFIGMYGIYFNTHPQIYLKNFFSLFIVNGIASFIFHWTLKKGWGLYDAFPMLILAYYGMFFSFDIILHKLYFHDHKRLYIILSSMSSFITISIMVFTMIHTALNSQQDAIFAIFFALPVVSNVVCCFIVWFVFYKDYDDFNHENFYPLQKILIRALLIGFTTAALWFTTELTCEDYKFPRYLYMHTIWHIGFSYSMYCFLIYILFLYSVNNGIKLEFKTSENRYLDKMYHILPVLNHIKKKNSNINNNTDIELAIK